MKIRIVFFTSFILLLATTQIFAQTKSGIKDSAALEVRFGPFRNNMTALAEDLKKLAGTTLVVADSGGAKWDLIEFRVGWRRKEESMDIKTGAKKTIFTYSAERVEDSSHLPIAWQNALKESIQSGETLLFEEIIVRHPKAGSIRRAKSLTIKVL